MGPSSNACQCTHGNGAGPGNIQENSLYMCDHLTWATHQAVEKINLFHATMFENGVLEQKRIAQTQHWMWQSLQDQIWTLLKLEPSVKELAKDFESQMARGTMTPRAAARTLLDTFLSKRA